MSTNKEERRGKKKPVSTNASSPSESDAPPKPRKKRPGRPKKNVVKTIIPKHGIVDKPSNADVADPRMVHTLEMLYDNPDMWKKIFTMFKHLGVETVRMQFREDRIVLIAKDRLNKIEALVEVYGTELNRYYCYEYFEISIEQSDMSSSLQSLKKEHSTIIFVTDKHTQKSQFHVILHHDVVNEDSCDNIEISEVDPYDGNIFEEVAQKADYPLHFTLGAKYLRDKISCWLRKSDKIMIEKKFDDPLTISNPYKNGRGSFNTTFNNNKAIELDSRISEECFGMSVHLQPLKSIASSIVSDKVRISVHSSEKIIFSFVLDSTINEDTKQLVDGTNTCEVHILTDIVNLKD